MNSQFAEHKSEPKRGQFSPHLSKGYFQIKNTFPQPITLMDEEQSYAGEILIEQHDRHWLVHLYYWCSSKIELRYFGEHKIEPK